MDSSERLIEEVQNRPALFDKTNNNYCNRVYLNKQWSEIGEKLNLDVSMADSEKILVRKATVDDYEAVLDINRNIYDGTDYVLLYYKDLVTDPDSSYYVCEVDGEVGAFEGVYLIDDNRTLMTRSARVKDKFQGRGLLNLIRKRIYEDFKNVPGEKRIRTCCTNQVRLVNSARFLSQNKTLATKTLAGYEFLENVTFPPPYDEIVPEVSEMSLEEFVQLFQIKELVSYLFPEGFFTLISWFFDPLVSNMKHIQKLSPYISISSTLEQQIQRLRSTAKQSEHNNVGSDQDGNGDDNLEGLMAINSHNASPSVFLFVIEIYGDPRKGREEDDLRNVVFHNLKHAVSLLENHDPKLPLALGFSMKNGWNVELYHKILAPLGFKTGPVTDAFKNHYYFEQTFEQLITS